MTRTRGTALAVAFLCLALAAPAQAARSIARDDVKGDGARDSDLTKVTTLHGLKRVVVKTRAHRDSSLPHEMWHLVDSTGDARPEFLVFSVIHNEVQPEPSAGVYAVDRWPSRKNPYRLLRDGDPVDCGLSVGRSSDHERLLTLTLGRGCFEVDGVKPERLRVSTFGTFEWGRITDVVPSWRAYGPWTPAA